MYNRILKKPLDIGQSFFLFGPRGTGKTTWLRQHFRGDDVIFLDLLNSDLYTELLARSHRLDTLIPNDFKGWVLLDEVQRVPALLNEVHRLIESRKLRFAMTGSSARSLRRKGTNLLAGRALTFHMYPLTALELGNDFNLSQAVRYGQLPSVQKNPAATEYLKSYIKTYLREEVQQEGLTRNIGNFTRFLETVSFSQGSPINVAEIARETSIDRKVVDGYLGILEDLLIAHRLPVFIKRAKRRMTSHSKFFFFDAGVYRAIRPAGPLDAPEEADGICVETLCLQELRAINDLLGFDYELFYWRTSDGTEVDFIMYGPRGILAFEIKRSRTYHRRDLNGLKSFKRDYPMAVCYLLYGGEELREEDGIKIIPLANALRNLPKLLQNPAQNS